MESENLSPYELLRLKRIEENRKVLKELGLLESDKPPVIRKAAAPKPVVPKKRPSVVNEINNKTDKLQRSIRTRRSSRLSLLGGEDTDNDADNSSYIDASEDESSTRSERFKIKRPNIYGQIDGIPVGTIWNTRMECSRDGVHKPTVAGIHGGKDGAYSIALSGGYEDDLDFGEGFTYTGSGGRDLKGTAAKPKNLRTAPQSKDQTLDGVNASLAANIESRLPIRVIRGYKLPSVYAPEEGYRYDGLYTVEKFWFATGLSGFQVIKFALKRLKEQDPPPWIESLVETIPADVTQTNEESNTSHETDLTFSLQPKEKAHDQKRKSPFPKKFVDTSKENETELVNKTSKTLLKKPDLDQDVSSKRSSLQKNDNSFNEGSCNIQENGIHPEDKKLSETLSSEHNVSPRKSLKKIDNFIQVNGSILEDNGKQISKIPSKSPCSKQNTSPEGSGKKINFSPEDNEKNKAAVMSLKNKPTVFPKKFEQAEVLSSRNSPRKKALSRLEENNANSNDHQLKKLNTLKEISDVGSSNGESKTVPNLEQFSQNKGLKQNTNTKKIKSKEVNNQSESLNRVNKSSTSDSSVSPQIKVPRNDKNHCDHYLKMLTDIEIKNRDVPGTILTEGEPFHKLPGQTTILKYFKRSDAAKSLNRKNITNECTIETCKPEDVIPKKIPNKEAVVGKSLRGNRRPSLFTDNNAGCSTSPDVFASGRKEKFVDSNSMTKTATDKPGNMPKKRKYSTSADVEREIEVSAAKTPRKVQNNSPVNISKKTPDHSPIIRNCYVKLEKISESGPTHFPSQNSGQSHFKGFYYTEYESSKSKKDQFNIFLKGERYQIPKQEDNELDGWPGWDTVPTCTAVDNSSLIDKYSNES